MNGTPAGYNLWRKNFGAGNQPAAGTSVAIIPEPATGLLLSMALAGGAFLPRKFGFLS